MGAVHLFLYKRGGKILKIGTIILISMMTFACKMIAMFTMSMGTLVLKCVISIHGFRVLRFLPTILCQAEVFPPWNGDNAVVTIALKE